LGGFGSGALFGKKDSTNISFGTHNIDLTGVLFIYQVKRLAVALDTPGLFWSAAEDGLVMQWDTRQATYSLFSSLYMFEFFY
jgi:hypothetical protein